MSRSTGMRTNLTPFPRNSSPNATPLALINLRLKVEAVLIPVGNPVPPFVARNLIEGEMNALCALIGDLPCRAIVHAKVRDVEATHGTGITNTSRSELSLANQDPELFIESELRCCSIRECPSLVPGSWLTSILRDTERSHGEDSY